MSRTATVICLVIVSGALALTVGFVTLAAGAAEGRELRLILPWLTTIDLSLAIRVDALAALFGTLVCGIGALVAAYSLAYVRRDTTRFLLHLVAFMLAMVGLIIADDLALLYVCWELTTISSFFLIGFHHESAAARDAARHALLVTTMGGLCLLAGFVLLATAGQSWRISELTMQGAALRQHPLYLPALLLVAVGAFTKSAQFPFHAWLPRAMQAPAPASAYLHAATMVNAGVYLLARLAPLLANTGAWTAVIVPVGVVTMLVGAVRAFGETELKRVLAYATVSALGILVTLLGVGTKKAVVAAMVYLVAHSLYKGALFLTAGAIEHQTGAKDLGEIRGLGRAMPRVAAAMGLAAASLAGVPPLLGFLGKDLAYEGLWPEDATAGLELLPLAGAFAASALFVAIALDIGARPLLGPRSKRLEDARDPSPWIWAPPMILAALGALAALAPSGLATLCAAAASDAVHAPVMTSDALLHGVTPALVLSLLTLPAGAALYANREPLRRAGAATARALRLRPAAGYERTMSALAALAGWQTRVLQNGYLSWYVVVVVGTAALLLALGLANAPLGEWERASTDLRLEDAGLMAVVLAAALAAVLTTSRFTAIAAMGVVGLAVGAIYLTVGAPDLAMTQFVVEILNVAVFVLAFSQLPRFRSLSSGARRTRDAAIACALGAAMFVLVLVAGRTEPSERASDWFAANALTAGHGHNVVNVILTDFRSIDTLGEIAVLASAAFGAVGLLRLRSTLP